MLALTSLAAAAFSPAGVPARAPAHQIEMIERSAAIPFLKRPPALDGSMVGDIGFDPLGFSTTITELGGDLTYVREAELMHGRQAMLACVGLWFPTAVGHIPVDWAAKVSANPLEAQYELPPAVIGQLVVSMALAEGLRARLVFSEGHVAGEHGFDPMGFMPKFCDTPEKMAAMKLKELKHGRIAMIASIGMIAQLMVKGSIWPFI